MAAPLWAAQVFVRRFSMGAQVRRGPFGNAVAAPHGRVGYWEGAAWPRRLLGGRSPGRDSP